MNKMELLVNNNVTNRQLIRNRESLGFLKCVKTDPVPHISRVNSLLSSDRIIYSDQNHMRDCHESSPWPVTFHSFIVNHHITPTGSSGVGQKIEWHFWNYYIPVDMLASPPRPIMSLTNYPEHQRHLQQNHHHRNVTSAYLTRSFVRRQNYRFPWDCLDFISKLI